LRSGQITGTRKGPALTDLDEAAKNSSLNTTFTRGHMIVRYWMTWSPQTATEHMTLREAFELMNRHGIRRLPVVRHQTMCGIVTLSDLYRFVRPSALTSETASADAADALQRSTIAEVMTTDPITCQLNSPLEDVGDLMRKRKVGALPVLQEERLVGIITESDVVRALVSITRSGEDGRRLCFRIPGKDKKKIFSTLVTLCEHYDIEIQTLLTHPLQEELSLMVMMRIRGERADQFQQALWNIHYHILTVE
jgi:acetoin utilization protein AcuB